MPGRSSLTPQRYGDGWRCRFTDSAGVRRWTPTQPTAADALRVATEQRAIRRGGALDLTLAQAAQLMRADLEANGRSAGTVRWFEGQMRVLLRFWSPDVPLRLLDRAELQRFADARLREVGAATVRHHLIALGRLQKLALRKGWQGTICARDVAIPTPRPPEPTVHPWHRIEALFRRVRRERPVDADVIELVARTGVRRQEAADIEAAHVDLANGLLLVKVGKRRPRRIPISPELRPVLVRMLEAANGGHLIPGGVETIARTFRRWRQRLGEQLNARAMRHSFGTAMVVSGAGIATAARVLGHAPGSAQVTMRYLGPADPVLREAVEAVSHQKARRRKDSTGRSG